MPGFLSNNQVFFWIAREAYLRSKRKPTEALTCIVFSAFGLEAFINVLSEFMRQGFGGMEPSGKANLLGQALAQFDDSRENLLARIQVTKVILSGNIYNKGAEPFQDVAMLLKVRNALVHPRPEKVHGSVNNKDLSTMYPKFISHLKNKGLVDDLNGGRTKSWYSLIETPKVAKWAYVISCSIIEDIIDSFPESPLKKMITMMRPDGTNLDE